MCAFAPSPLLRAYSHEFGRITPGISLRKETKYVGLFFLPAVGYRLWSTGVLTSPDAGGWYWSSSQIVGMAGSRFYFASDTFLLDSAANNAQGFNVRCVR